MNIEAEPRVVGQAHLESSVCGPSGKGRQCRDRVCAERNGSPVTSFVADVVESCHDALHCGQEKINYTSIRKYNSKYLIVLTVIDQKVDYIKSTVSVRAWILTQV